jgi:DnaK suppressor protein
LLVDIEKAKIRLQSVKDELEAFSELSSDARAPVKLDQQSVGRLSRMDSMQQQAMAQAQERNRQRDLVRIEMAHRRILEDEYGYCANCGEEIPDKRLEIDPMAERCVGCAD